MAKAKVKRLMNARVAILNINMAAVDGWGDGTRQVAIRDMIRAQGASVVTSQENNLYNWFCSASGLGTNWFFRRHGNSNIMFDGNQHDLVDNTYYQLDLPTPVGPGYSTRRLVGLQLLNKAAQQTFWVHATHFQPGTDEFNRGWQAQQMEACLDAIGSRDPANAVFGLDMNDSRTLEGPRVQARNHPSRMFDLRNKLACVSEYGPGRCSNGDLNTFTGYVAPARGKEWIDDLLTGDNLLPYYMRMVDTWTDDLTDHAAQRMSFIRLS